MWRKENPCQLLLGMQVGSHIRKQYEVFSKKLKIELPNDPANLLPSVCSIKSVSGRDIRTPCSLQGYS